MLNESFHEWFDLAGRLSAEEALAVRSGKGREVLNAFSQRSSVNPNMLRKMQRARLYIETNEPEIVGDLSQVPLSYIDVLSRIGAIDSVLAHRTALQLAGNPSVFTYRKLLKAYDEIRSDRSKIGIGDHKNKSHVAQFKKDVLEAAKFGHLNFIYPEVIEKRKVVTFRPWKGGHEFVSPFMTSRIKDLGSRANNELSTDKIDGFDCYLQYENDPHEVVRDRVMRGSVEATFFKRLWLVLPADRGRLYEQLVYNLGPSNLGVLRYCSKSSIFDCTLRPENEPNPDRRRLWTEHSISYCAK